MAIDAPLAERVREVLRPQSPFREVKMFGGLTLMVSGSMCCGVSGQDLVLRVGVDMAADLISRGDAAIFAPIGRPVAGMVIVVDANTLADSKLRAGIDHATAFVSTLPPKN